MTKDEEKFYEDEIECAKHRATLGALLAKHRVICARLTRHLEEYCEAVKKALEDSTK